MAKQDDDIKKPDFPHQDGVDLIERSETKVKKPSMWNVVLCNDDFTPMDFVVFVLKHIFHKSQQDADMLTLDIHLKGKGIAGTFSYEVAETKQALTMDMAKLEQHPLLAVLEKI